MRYSKLVIFFKYALPIATVLIVVLMYLGALWIESKDKERCQSSCHPYRAYFMGWEQCSCAGPDGRAMTKEERCADSCHPYAYRFGDDCKCFDPVAKEFRVKP